MKNIDNKKTSSSLLKVYDDFPSVAKYPDCLKQICDLETKLYGWWSGSKNEKGKNLSSLTNSKSIKCAYKNYEENKLFSYTYDEDAFIHTKMHEFMKKRPTTGTLTQRLQICDKDIETLSSLHSIKDIFSVMSKAHPMSTEFCIKLLSTKFDHDIQKMNDYLLKNMDKLMFAENFGCVAYVFDVLRPTDLIQYLTIEKEIDNYSLIIRNTYTPLSFAHLLIFWNRLPSIFDPRTMSKEGPYNRIFANVCHYGPLESLKIMMNARLNYGQTSREGPPPSTCAEMSAEFSNPHMVIYLVSKSEFIELEQNFIREYYEKEPCDVHCTFINILGRGMDVAIYANDLRNIQMMIDYARIHSLTLQDFYSTTFVKENIFNKSIKPIQKVFESEFNSLL